MSYVAMYRTYRPQTFLEVSGQQVLVQTLQNAVANNTIAHAYLFSGPRGTGKTSIAKILAKAVNCLSTKGKPCNECEVCKAINTQTVSDVIEIDAASNNGVDEIRDLRDKVKYAPSHAKYKVYIIDEVHMLTSGAFNALLKTLEEPPKHVIFILATTEVHKIPATILSRCQRFDFKNLTEEEIIKRLEEITAIEKIDISKEALTAIAKHAEGGMRDAISLLDQVVSYSNKNITINDVFLISGSLPQEIIIHLIKAISSKDTSKALGIIDDLLTNGKEVTRIINDLVLGLRDILLEKATKIKGPYYEISRQLELPKIYYHLEILNELQQDIKWTHQKRAYLELAIIKLMNHQVLDQIDQEAIINDLRRAVLELEHKLKNLELPNRVTVTKKENQPIKGVPLVTIKDVENILNNGNKEKKELLQSGWHSLTGHPNPNLAMIANMLGESRLEAMTNDVMLIVCNDKQTCIHLQSNGNKEKVKEILNSKTQLISDFVAIPASDWEIVKETYVTLFKKSKKPKLPAYDFNLYEDKIVSSPEKSRIVSLAEEYFGIDKVEVIKE